MKPVSSSMQWLIDRGVKITFIDQSAPVSLARSAPMAVFRKKGCKTCRPIPAITRQIESTPVTSTDAPETVE